jgi:hypothetical protein
MQWNPWKTKTSLPLEQKSPGSNAQAEFQEAARQVVEEQPTAPASSPVSPTDSGPEILEKLNVSEDHAREVVKICFWPLAHYVDPLWALSDEEAQPATPKMQAFLQWLLMKYAPAVTLKLAARFPEILAVAVAMALVAWRKAQIVMAAQQSAQPAQAGEPATPEPETYWLDCEVCGKGFVSREALGAHLPCNPA